MASRKTDKAMAKTGKKPASPKQAAEKPAGSETRVIEVGPVKDLFIEMLVRDIELRHAIIDPH